MTGAIGAAAAGTSCASWWTWLLVGMAAGLACAVVALVVVDRLVMGRIGAGELYQQLHPERAEPARCTAVSREPGADGHRCGLDAGHGGPHVCPDCGGDYEWDEGRP